MNPIRRGQNRERWNVTNLSTKYLTISDLPSVPVIDPQKTVDVLYYETKEKVSTSVILPLLQKTGKVSIEKIGVDGNTIVTNGTVDTALQPAQKDMVIANEGSGGGGGSGDVGTPTYSYTSVLNVAAGSVAQLDSSPIPSGAIANLTGIMIGCPVPARVSAVLVHHDVEGTPFAIGQIGSEHMDYRPPSSAYFQVIGSNTGFNGFRVKVHNLDVSDSADIYAIFYWLQQ